MDPSRMSERELQCLRTLLKSRETSDTKDSVPEDDNKLNSCEGIKQEFRTAVEQAVQEVIADKQLHTGDAVMEASHARKKSKQETRSIAHLTISNHTWGPQSKVNLAFWNYKEGWANILNMSYNDGKLKVLQDGFYYVYANICFRHHENSGNVFLHKSLQLMMYICKSNPKRTQNETLMKGGSTKYWSNNSVYHFYSVYQGGVFKLLAGEEILIKVSYPALLDPAQEATYFGAFKILDQEL
ncbi:tumor necrosis factor ligand superfamily member 11 isoform X2 [Ascaphus truei]